VEASPLGKEGAQRAAKRVRDTAHGIEKGGSEGWEEVIRAKAHAIEEEDEGTDAREGPGQHTEGRVDVKGAYVYVRAADERDVLGSLCCFLGMTNTQSIGMVITRQNTADNMAQSMYVPRWDRTPSVLVLACTGRSSLLPLAIRQCAVHAGLPNGLFTVLTGDGRIMDEEHARDQAE
jgi:hypothetical protein